VIFTVSDMETNMVFEGWAAVGMIILLALAGGAYVAIGLIGFNREEARKGFPPERF
jgi:hypothetical protein